MKNIFRKKREGKYTVMRGKGSAYEINCLDFYIEGGFLVIEHKDGDVEFFPVEHVVGVVKYKTKNES